MNEELLHKVALSLTPHVTVEVVRAIQENHVSLEEFFRLPMHSLTDRLGLTSGIRLEDLQRQEAMFRARKELEFMESHHIRGLFYGDDEYPEMLTECPDAPVLLYVLGDADLNRKQSVAVVGTRRCTAYGSGFTTQLVKDLALYYPEMAVISGLAYGIDAAAHQAAIDSGLVTFAVLAHGLDTIYPAAHRDLARRILSKGGALITEYCSGTNAYRNNFLMRNRIVAGMSDVTIVAESEIKGGAMSTANTAFHYNREVMALPGRSNDIKSSGCNHLIRKEKAHLVTCAADVVEMTGWVPQMLKQAPVQRNLFPELDGLAKQVYECLLYEREPISIDSLRNKLNVKIRDLLATMTEMEFDGIVSKLPGSRYTLG